MIIKSCTKTVIIHANIIHHPLSINFHQNLESNPANLPNQLSNSFLSSSTVPRPRCPLPSPRCRRYCSAASFSFSRRSATAEPMFPSRHRVFDRAHLCPSKLTVVTALQPVPVLPRRCCTAASNPMPSPHRTSPSHAAHLCRALPRSCCSSPATSTIVDPCHCRQRRHLQKPVHRASPSGVVLC